MTLPTSEFLRPGVRLSKTKSSRPCPELVALTISVVHEGSKSVPIFTTMSLDPGRRPGIEGGGPGSVPVKRVFVPTLFRDTYVSRSETPGGRPRSTRRRSRVRPGKRRSSTCRADDSDRTTHMSDCVPTSQSSGEPVSGPETRGR